MGAAFGKRKEKMVTAEEVWPESNSKKKELLTEKPQSTPLVYEVREEKRVIALSEFLRGQCKYEWPHALDSSKLLFAPIPDDILKYWFLFVAWRDLGSLRRTCHRFERILSDSNFERNLYNYLLYRMYRFVFDEAQHIWKPEHDREVLIPMRYADRFPQRMMIMMRMCFLFLFFVCLFVFLHLLSNAYPIMIRKL
jgi:hypothetical protein